ncbi:MAG: hypothetical protein L0Z50_35975 [Verrucomicrobiales bacterium]|nr:hypothetical protein [Verrucomicrobiales bacterium]
MNLRSRNANLCWILPLVLVSFTVAIEADQLELVNGDRYIGKVIAVTETNVTLRSEINGLMQLPRSKVTVITFGDKMAAPTTAPPPAPVALTAKPAPKDLAAQIKAQGIDPKSIKQVREQILGAATPEVTGKFNEMVSGLIVGRLSVDDIRAQARSSVKELQAAKTELGEEFGTVLDGYLNILESFLNETEAEAAATPKRRPQSKTSPAQEQQVEPNDDE